jgi:DNA-directed RNA polymerase subunit M/transcription elongation factor TFIIS
MTDNPWPAVLRCNACHAEHLFQREQMIERLGAHQMLKRNAEPTAEFLAELWNATVSRFACPDCGAHALCVAAAGGQDDWGQAVACEVCGEPISAERLEVLPDSTLCASCQARDDRGEAPANDVEYCPRCGNIMQVKSTNRGGLAGYRLVCGACRR